MLKQDPSVLEYIVSRSSAIKRAVVEKDEFDKKDLRGLWVTFHQRIAFSSASLVFMFMGIPIASIVKREEVVISFGISMAAMGLYYILSAIAQSIASRGGLPPVIVLWLPNIILIGVGAFLLRKAILS